MNNAAVNLGLPFSVEDPAFSSFVCVPSGGAAGSSGASPLDFGNGCAVRTAAAPPSLPPASLESCVHTSSVMLVTLCDFS